LPQEQARRAVVVDPTSPIKPRRWKFEGSQPIQVPFFNERENITPPRASRSLA
jgi:hypothetical protein